MKANEELLKENAELRSNIYKLESLVFALENSPDKERDINMIINAAYKLPDQHLADVKADAVVEAANKTIVHHNKGYCLHCEVIEYANKLRGESK